VGGVAIEDGGISVSDLSGVVNNDDLGGEGVSFTGRVILYIRADKSSLEFLDGEGFHIESYVVSWLSFRDSFVMHFDRFNFTL
jgi:hypothetical protein